MPYFVYKVHPGKRFELHTTFGSYREARDQASSLRAAMTGGEDYSIKVMFARDAEEAERQMAEEREPRPLGEDA
jgi:hypothetical protein